MTSTTGAQNKTALILCLIAALSALQTSGVMQSFVSAENTMSTNNQASFQIQPMANTINAGDIAKYDIRIVQGSTADVLLVARGVPPDSVAIFTPDAGVANPDFNSTLTIVTSADTPTGNYAIMAVAIINGKEVTDQVFLLISTAASVTTFANATTSVSFGTTLSMTVSTDKSQYEPNSTVSIQGHVTDLTGNAVSDATIAIQVDTPTGAELFYTNSLHTDSAGIFQAQVNLPSNSPTGTYTVFTSATRGGYSPVTTRTTFVVGTSSTPSVVIDAVYAGDSTGNPSPTFTVGQTIWIWVVIGNNGATFQGVVWIQVRDPNGVPVQIQIQISKLDSGQTIKDGIGFTMLGHPATGVYTVNALVSDKLISQGGTFLASADTEFALVG